MEPDAKRSRRPAKSALQIGEVTEEKQAPLASTLAAMSPATNSVVRARFMQKQMKDTERAIERLMRDDSYALFESGDPYIAHADELPEAHIINVRGKGVYLRSTRSSTESSAPEFTNFGEVKARHIAGGYLPVSAPVSQSADADYPPLPEPVQLLRYDALLEDLCAVLQRVICVTAPSDTQGTLGRESRRLQECARESVSKLQARLSNEAEAVNLAAFAEHMMVTNQEACVQTEWRKEACPPREYKRYLHDDYAPAEDLPPAAAAAVMDDLATALPDGYFGQCYSYEDEGLSEEWMRALAAPIAGEDPEQPADLDNDAILAMVAPLLHNMVQRVTDRVSNDRGALSRPPLSLGADLCEVPVRGCDGQARHNIVMVLRKVMGDPWARRHSKRFVEQLLLPAVNRQTGPESWWMKPALQEVAAGGGGGSAEDCAAASAALGLIKRLGPEYFHCHPKGTGILCSKPEGIPELTFVNKYLGELYPGWRWCERLDAVEDAQARYGLKPGLPDFYNIVLERPRVDARGYGLLFVEAGRHVANLSSSLSHSCDPNCTTAVVVRDGRLCIALTTLRPVKHGEELTMDYYSTTSSELEWREAVCLCGMTSCRGSFLSFTGAQSYSSVLSETGTASAYTSLLKSSTTRRIDEASAKKLQLHGFGEATLGRHCPEWLKHFCVSQLGFIEYERRKLPLQLIASSSAAASSGGPGAGHLTADEEARSVMEQRVQSLATAIGCIYHLLTRQPEVLALTQRQQRSAATGQLELVEVETEESAAAIRSSPPPLKIVKNPAVVEALWTGRDSMARRLVAKLETLYGTSSLPWPMFTLQEQQQYGSAVAAAINAAAAAAASEAQVHIAPPKQQQSSKSPMRAAAKLQDAGRHCRAGTASNGCSMDDRPEYGTTLQARVSLWHTADGYRLPEAECPTLDVAMSFVLERPHLQLYGGQDLDDMTADAAGGSSSSSSSKSKQDPPLEPAVQQVAASLVRLAKHMVYNSEVKHGGQMRAELLDMRRVLRALPSTSRARNTAAADLVLLLAHTVNFSAPEHYEPVQGLPVHVHAREVGVKVPVSVLEQYESSTGQGHSASIRVRQQALAARAAAATAAATAAAAAAAAAALPAPACATQQQQQQHQTPVSSSSERRGSTGASSSGGNTSTAAVASSGGSDCCGSEGMCAHHPLYRFAQVERAAPCSAASEKDAGIAAANAAAAAAAGDPANALFALAAAAMSSDAEESQATTAAATPPPSGDWQNDEDDEQNDSQQQQQCSDDEEEDSFGSNNSSCSGSESCSGAGGGSSSSRKRQQPGAQAAAVALQAGASDTQQEQQRQRQQQQQRVSYTAEEADALLRACLAEGGDPEELISVWNTRELRKLTRTCRRKNLANYLSMRPHMQVYAGQTSGKQQKKAAARGTGKKTATAAAHSSSSTASAALVSTGAAASASVAAAAAAASSATEPIWLKGDEVVHEFRREYSPFHILAQLLEWHSENRGKKADALCSEFAGCVQIPDPLLCYKGRAVYNDTVRGMLLMCIEDPEHKKHPWPEQLVSAFTGGLPLPSDSPAFTRIPFGSPLADAAMGTTFGQKAVVACLMQEGADQGQLERAKRRKSVTASTAVDANSSSSSSNSTTNAAACSAAAANNASSNNSGGSSRRKAGAKAASGSAALSTTAKRGSSNGRKAGNSSSSSSAAVAGTAQARAAELVAKEGELAQELPDSAWVQCEECLMWRRLPWHMSEKDLKDKWVCEDNDWAPEFAKCHVPQEPEELDEVWTAAETGDIADEIVEAYENGSEGECTPLVAGQFVDAYCLKTNKWYASKLLEVERGRAKVHFQGWNAKHDEWLPRKKGFFKPLGLRTPATKFTLAWVKTTKQLEAQRVAAAAALAAANSAADAAAADTSAGATATATVTTTTTATITTVTAAGATTAGEGTAQQQQQQQQQQTSAAKRKRSDSADAASSCAVADGRKPKRKSSCSKSSSSSSSSSGSVQQHPLAASTASAQNGIAADTTAIAAAGVALASSGLKMPTAAMHTMLLQEQQQQQHQQQHGAFS